MFRKITNCVEITTPKRVNLLRRTDLPCGPFFGAMAEGVKSQKSETPRGLFFPNKKEKKEVF